MALKKYDVIIAGASFVGMSMALALAQLPLRIALLEAREMTLPDSDDVDQRGLALSAVSQRIFQGLGLWPSLADRACPIASVHVSQQGQLGRTLIDAKEEQAPALGYVVPAFHLLTVLREQVLAQDNIDFLCPAPVSEISQHAEHVTVTYGEEKITAPLLIAADGQRSMIRKQLNIAVDAHDYQQDAIVTNVRLGRSHQQRAYERFTPQGILAMLPLSDQRSVSILSVDRGRASELLNLPDHDYLAHLQQLFGYRLGRLQAISKRQTHPLTMQVAQSVVADRVVLLGNAAQSLNPVAAQGFNLGLRDCAALATLLKRNLRDVGASEVLRDYQDARKVDVTRIRRLSDGLAHVFNSSLAPLAMARGAGLLAMDCLPMVKSEFANLAMGNNVLDSPLAAGLPL